MSHFTVESPVGEIVAEQPASSKAFYQYNIDFCCGGGLPLSKACEKSGANPQAVLDAVEKAINNDTSSDRNWNDAPLPSLVGHILVNYHEPLRIELERLGNMLAKVIKVHGHVDTERFMALDTVFSGLSLELLNHMQKEENILFPIIMQGRGASAAMPVQMMEHEHEEAGEALREIKRLTNDYTPPEYACNTWRALWAGFGTLEREMHRHIHLENNILFPKALQSASA